MYAPGLGLMAEPATGRPFGRPGRPLLPMRVWACHAPRPLARSTKAGHSWRPRMPAPTMTPAPSRPLARNQTLAQIAVAVAGFCAFINLYSPQAILPLLSSEFSASAAQVSTIITVSTLAVAITAPFTGAIADVLGRKRVIVAAMFVLVIPTLMLGFAQSLSAMLFWRAVQGLVLPPVFAVTVAYIGDEWPPAGATRAAGIYSSASSVGGFSGRLIVGILADLVSWRAGFLALGTAAFFGAVAVALLLPKERGFVRSDGFTASMRQMLAHFRNGQLLATY